MVVHYVYHSPVDRNAFAAAGHFEGVGRSYGVSVHICHLPEASQDRLLQPQHWAASHACSDSRVSTVICPVLALENPIYGRV